MVSDSAIHACAGAAGGCVSMAITYPLVNLSTRSQVAAKGNGQSTRSAALKVIKEDGIVGLYDGLTSSLLGIAITNGIYYACFEETRSVLLRNKKSSRGTLTTLESILTSAVAGAATSIFSNPIWVVNTRQTVRSTVQSDPSLPTTANKTVVEKKLGVLQTILHILRTDGFWAFFHGLGPALVLVSNPILQFTLFEQLKNMILARRSIRLSKGSAAAPPLTDLDFFLLGAVSKLFATGITYPYLTVKARMQAGGAEGKSYTSAVDGLRKIVKQDGVAGLYRGIGPKITQSVATAALLFLAKEKIYVATKKALSTVAKV
ncbi:mitochondrial carrier [Leucosporidium creatinivorum]|uniref:Mitochondrial carrier n=1 Tax=Leucosporidium creatinivorum TaxID=106004 RepID=A0A1Y2DPI1_9BASI|nr:mitochondrial carrier [Leucosporidium creatinivorum]